MTKPQILITGAGGEIGHSLIDFLYNEGKYDVLTLDLAPLKHGLDKKCKVCYQGNILDKDLIAQIDSNHKIEIIFHLAAILSTGGEKNPALTHDVNVNGSFNILNLAKSQSDRFGAPVKFIFPSTIAAYGFQNFADKVKNGVPVKVQEDQFLHPVTMYGVNKQYVENMGAYYADNFKLFDSSPSNVRIDFRGVRFPGLISSETVPTGGTSDYGAEMLHNGAQGKTYDCFVRPDSSLPFMSMPDAVTALIELSRADAKKLTRKIYNVGSFSMSAEEIRKEVLKYFPAAQIGYKINETRQHIVDSWPGDVDDSAARKDWGWNPKYDRQSSFANYLVPAIIKRYSTEVKNCANG